MCLELYKTQHSAEKCFLKARTMDSACMSSKSLVDFRVAAFTVVRATLPTCTILAGARPASTMGREARGNI